MALGLAAVVTPPPVLPLGLTVVLLPGLTGFLAVAVVPGLLVAGGLPDAGSFLVVVAAVVVGADAVVLGFLEGGG